jgi:hypothetical protein
MRSFVSMCLAVGFSLVLVGCGGGPVTTPAKAAPAANNPPPAASDEKKEPAKKDTGAKADDKATKPTAC